MIPPDLSQHSLSLKKGCDRPAISLLVTLDRGGEILDFRFVPSVVRIHRQLTYDEVNASLHDDVLLKESFEMSKRLRQKRLAQGALNLSLPELNITFNADSSLSLEFVDQNTPSRMIVAEFMILYNWLAARFCRDRDIPTLYRTQSEPSEILSLDDTGYLYYVLQQRRKLSPLQIATSPRPHYGLGLDAYTQATSPIRRYLDLVVQRQMKSFLTGKGPRLDEEGLEEVRMRVGPATKTLEMIKRKRLRYWTLKFLSQHRGETMKAVVLDELKSKYRIALSDLYLVGEMKRQDGMILRSGQEIQVEVKRVDPWEDLLELAYVGG
jgi:exoribonuclease-2